MNAFCGLILCGIGIGICVAVLGMAATILVMVIHAIKEA